MFETSPNLFENRTELPAVVNRRMGVAYLPSSVATPLDPSEGVVPILLGSYYTYWSCKCFDPYFLDQPLRIFVNGGKFSNQYI